MELAKFRRRQILRIMVRDVMGLGTLPEITGELTAVADAIVEVAYERIYQDLVAQYGQPRSDDRSEEPRISPSSPWERWAPRNSTTAPTST